MGSNILFLFPSCLLFCFPPTYAFLVFLFIAFRNRESKVFKRVLIAHFYFFKLYSLLSLYFFSFILMVENQRFFHWCPCNLASFLRSFSVQLCKLPKFNFLSFIFLIGSPILFTGVQVSDLCSLESRHPSLILSVVHRCLHVLHYYFFGLDNSVLF